MALIIPEAVGKRRGGALPVIGWADVPFTTSPPIRFRSINLLNSSPYPKVPLAVMTGLLKRIPANSAVRSGTWLIWASRNLAYNFRAHGIEAELSVDERGRSARHTGDSCRPDRLHQ